MDVEALPSEIATLGRTGINEWTAVWTEGGINPSLERRKEIGDELQAMLCPHQASARFVYRDPGSIKMAPIQ